LHKTFIGVFAKLREETIIFIISVRLFVCVRPYGRPTVCDNVVPNWPIYVKSDIEYFLKIFRENLSFFKIQQEQRARNMTTYVHLW